MRLGLDLIAFREREEEYSWKKTFSALIAGGSGNEETFVVLLKLTIASRKQWCPPTNNPEIRSTKPCEATGHFLTSFLYNFFLVTRLVDDYEEKCI